MVLNILNGIIDTFGKVVFFNVLSIFGIKDAFFPFAIFVLFVGYILLMIKLNFVQITRFKKCIQYSFFKNPDAKKGETSSLKTLLTSMASCTGMNATAGVVFMIYVGGPGTVFWIPIITLLCMAFRFAEVYLSHSYRSSTSSDHLGGPFDYIKKGLAELGFAKLGKFLSLTYAMIMIISGTIGVSMYEMNQFTTLITSGFHIRPEYRKFIALLGVSVACYIVFGGTKRIANFMSVVLPIVSITYIVVAIIVVAFNYKNIGNALVVIFQDAMHPKTIAGGFMASFCMSARKISLSHETGLGTSGIVHATSPEKDSVKEATRAMMTPVINGMVICMLSALVVVVSGVYKTDLMKDGVVALSIAFSRVNSLFAYVVIVMIPLLVFNVFLGWSNYLSKCVKYVFNKQWVVYIVIVLMLCCAFIGGIVDDFTITMNLVDVFVLFILILNVPVVVALSGKVKKALK